MEVLNIFLFIVSGKYNHIIEVMPFMYVVDGWIMIYLQRRVMMYNVEDSIHSSMGAQENNAYIIFDKQKIIFNHKTTNKMKKFYLLMLLLAGMILAGETIKDLIRTCIS